MTPVTPVSEPARPTEPVEPADPPLHPPADVAEAWPVERSELVWDSGRVIAVRTDLVVSPSGERLHRDLVVHPGAVGILCLDPDDRVLVVDQYRHPVRHRLLEPPAGLLDVADEDPATAAARELFEEGAVRARSWHVLVEADTSPGMSSEGLRIYLARDLTDVASADRHVPEGEEAHMAVTWIPLDDLARSVLAGRLHNPTMVMGVLAVWAARARGWTDLRPADSPWPFREHLLAER